MIHDTLQTTFLLSDAVINETPWHCAPLQHDRLFQLINGVELHAAVDSLLHGRQMAYPSDLNPGCWGLRLYISGSMQLRDSFVQWAMRTVESRSRPGA